MSDITWIQAFQILLQMFRTMFSDNTELSDEKINELANAFMDCSRPKLLSKIFKIIVKNFREIFSVLQTEKGSDFTHYPFLSSGFHVPQLSGVFPS